MESTTQELEVIQEVSWKDRCIKDVRVTEFTYPRVFHGGKDKLACFVSCDVHIIIRFFHVMF